MQDSTFWELFRTNAAILVALVAVVSVVVLWLLSRRRKRSARNEPRGASKGESLADLDELIRAALGGEERTELIPPPSIEFAEESAARRTERIEAFFSRGRTFDSRGLEEYAPSNFFFEYDRPSSRTDERIDNRYEFLAQAERLRWQMRSVERLLGDRVMDLIISRLSTVGLSSNYPGKWKESNHFELPVVQLIHDPRIGPGLFPWKVLVRSNDIRRIEEVLRSEREQLGIGVDVAPALPIVARGRCTLGQGLVGSTGGVIESHGRQLKMTCAHVISSECGSHEFSCSPSGQNTDLPDLALIRDSNCFPSRPLHTCGVADAQRMDEICHRGYPLTLHSERRGRRRGVVLSRILGINIGQNYSRFRHAFILPMNSGLDSVLHPFDRDFSAEGDSGNWVFDETSGDWVGMITAGVINQPLSVVAEADAIMTFLQHALPYGVGSVQRFTNP